MDAVLNQIKQNFNNRIDFRTRGEDKIQILAPFYHEDGDMYDIFIEIHGDRIRICDYGLSLMRLSYSYEIDTPKKEQILSQVLNDMEIQNDNGNLFIDTKLEHIVYAINRFALAISKIISMSNFRREVVKSLFYEDLQNFVTKDLLQFFPKDNYQPIERREDLIVDYYIPSAHKDIFLFGALDFNKTRLVSISCLEFLRNNIPFRSVVVHEDFESLPAKDRKIITNIVDKQFTDLEDFKANAVKYLEREIA